MSNVSTFGIARPRRDVERARDAARRAGEHAVDRVARRLARRHHARVRAQDVDLGAARPSSASDDCSRSTYAPPAAARRSSCTRSASARTRGTRAARRSRSSPGSPGGSPRRGRRSPARGGRRRSELISEIVSDSTPESTRSRITPSTCSRSTAHQRVAARVHPLDRLARVGQRGRRIGLDHDDPARQRAGRLRAREVQDLPEALGRDQPHARALGLQHRVGRDRRAVDDVAEVGGRDPRRLADPRHAGQHALRRVAAASTASSRATAGGPSRRRGTGR